MSKLITRQELAELLQLHVRTLDRYRREGRLSYVRLRGAIRFAAEDVQTFLKRCRVGV